ncbi:MAG TPA: DUF1461 domain-containing protein [Patescibacteria group bacterium]|nr:DUF1461 domain-containing protein [Patescibacteria group bacterium]
MTPHPLTARTLPERAAALATAAAAAIVVIAVAILPFLTPAWIAFEQGRTGAAALTGYSEPNLRVATDAILHDLVIGPPEFAIEVDGVAVLAERERGHMRDVRTVFAGFAVLALGLAVLLVGLVAGARHMGHPERAWAAVSSGMRWLIVGIVVAGVISVVAFDAAFEMFHRVLFPGGNYTFEPSTDRLVQLFPFEFWSETTIAIGGVILVLAALLATVTGRRARAIGLAVAPGSSNALTATRPEGAR